MKKVRIKRVPTAAAGGPQYGDQDGYALYTGTAFPGGDDGPGIAVNNTFPEVERHQATVEAEKGETILSDADGDGRMEHFKIGGERHEQGGTPIAAGQGDFIFSDRRKLAIKGPVLENFGKNPDDKKGFTPAQLAKQYDINKYKAIAEDPEADHIQKKTAELMIQNYEQKLAELALVQEGMKGFPNGVPGFADAILHPEQAPQEGAPEMGEGGLVEAKWGAANFNPIKKHQKDNTGDSKTPTGKSNAYDQDDAYLKTWEGIIPGISDMDNKAAQALIYQHMLKNNPAEVRKMWKENGLTKAGFKNADLVALTNNGKFEKDIDDASLASLQDAYVDGYFGVRQMKAPVAPTTPATPGTTAGTPPAKTVPPITTNPAKELNPMQPSTGSPMNWWTQDKMNTMSAFMNRYGLKKYLPWEPVANAVLPDPTFVDPTRALASNAEQATIQTQAAAQFAGPQRQRAVSSSIQGQAAGQAAQIISQYDTQNVGIANQFAGQRAQIQQGVQMENLASKKRLYDGTTLANSNFDKEKLMANDVIRKQVVNGMTNAQKTGWMNSFFDQFDVDPTTGAILFNNAKQFQFGRTGANSGGTSPGKAYLDSYMQLKNDPAYAGASDEVLREQAKAMSGFGTQQKQDTDGDGIPDKLKTLNALMGSGITPFTMGQ